MPKIPLPNSAAIKHTSAASPLTGGGLKLHYYGDNGLGKALSGAGAAVGRGLTQLSSKMIEFQKEYEQTENKLAAAEDRALFARSSEELRMLLAENPGVDDATRMAWVKDFQEKYAENRKAITSRMTEDFRKLHDVEMMSMQESAANRQRLIIIEAGVTRQRDTAENLYKQACERGDFTEARRIIDEYDGSLWNSEIAARLRDHDLPSREQYFLASKLVNANPEQAAQELNAVDKQGQYTRFSHLSINARQQLLRAAKGKAAENITNFTQEYIAQINSGTLTETTESLTQKFNSGMISQSQYNAVMPYVKRFQESKTQDLAQDYLTQIYSGTLTETTESLTQKFNSGMISQDKFNAAFPIIEKYEEARKKGEAAAQKEVERLKQQDIRLQQLRVKDAAGAFVLKTIYNSDGTPKYYSEAELAQKRLELIKIADGSTSVLEEYLPKLNRAAAPKEAAPKETTGASGDKASMWKTPAGKIIDTFIKDVGKDKYAYRWDPAGWEDSEDWDPDRQLIHHLMMELQYRQLAEDLYVIYKNPKDVMDTLRWARLQLNDGTVSSFLQWREREMPNIKARQDVDRSPVQPNRPKAGDK